MKRMLINATQADEVRVAVTDGSQLIDLDIETPGQEQKKSNIYKGIISSVEPSLGAVFVNYGSERHGFLPLKEISHEYFLTQDDTAKEGDIPNLRKLLKEGQPLVVQVEKEERGSKGAALTTFISLAGAFLVLMPNSPRSGGISRRIEGEERDQLREAISQLNVPEGMGIIIRTAGVRKSKEELEWDLNVLLRYWDAIKQAATIKSGAYLIHQESDVIIRGIRDHLRQHIDEIVVDEEDAYQRAYHYLNQIKPDFVNNLKLYNDHLPLFSRFQIEQHIETAYQREVQLPSGGSIVIDHTEALVSIDINSARATKGSNIEETALNINLEAADEIAKQLRIRDIGGLLVIDFIDMSPTRNQREVENRLRNAVRQDRARIQIGRISRFGLMEMSRQRIRSSLMGSNHINCPRCDGQGIIRSVESQAASIIHLLQEQTSKAKHVHFQVQLPIDLSAFILNEKREMVNNIEKNCEVKITIIPNKYLESPHYQIKQTKCLPEQLEHGKGVTSHSLLKSIDKPEINTTKKTAHKASAEPAINQFLGNLDKQKNTQKTSSETSLIKRLWTKLFNTEITSQNTNSATKKPAARKHNTSGHKARKKSTSPRSKTTSRPERKPQTQDKNRNTAQRNTARSKHISTAKSQASYNKKYQPYPSGDVDDLLPKIESAAPPVEDSPK